MAAVLMNLFLDRLPFAYPMSGGVIRLLGTVVRCWFAGGRAG